MKRRFSIEKLPHPEQSGDWHDKPVRWIARCLTDNYFTQKFSTKRDAENWRKVASRAADFGEASHTWMAL